MSLTYFSSLSIDDSQTISKRLLRSFFAYLHYSHGYWVAIWEGPCCPTTPHGEASLAAATAEAAASKSGRLCGLRKQVVDRSSTSFRDSCVSCVSSSQHHSASLRSLGEEFCVQFLFCACPPALSFARVCISPISVFLCLAGLLLPTSLRRSSPIGASWNYMKLFMNVSNHPQPSWTYIYIFSN